MLITPFDITIARNEIAESRMNHGNSLSNDMVEELLNAWEERESLKVKVQELEEQLEKYADAGE